MGVTQLKIHASSSHAPAAMRLDESLTLVRRETTGNEYKGSLNRSLFEFFDGIIHGNGMVVHHAEYTVIIFGKLNPFIMAPT